MLAGTYEVSLDTAGRVTIPSRLRSQLGSEVVVTTLLPPIQFLMLFEREYFEWFVRQFFPKPSLDRRQMDAKRALVGNAFYLKVDKAGRVLVPQGLREAAGLTGPGRVVGMGEHAELWSDEQFAEWQRRLAEPEMAQRATQTLESLTALQWEQPQETV